MAATRVSSDADLEAPLLSAGGGGAGSPPRSPISRSHIRLPGLRGAARFLRRNSNRRLMRGPSATVRETAVQQLEDRQDDLAYSRPVVALDMFWNLAFVSVAVAALIVARDERPAMPLRLWLVGYAAQCLVHIGCLYMEYRRRYPWIAADSGGGSFGTRSPGEVDTSSDDEQSYIEDDNISITRHIESMNTVFSFIWWIAGFYWVGVARDSLGRDAPQLFWVCTVFLAVDIIFVVFCISLACVVGVAVCCCLPCIIAILYAVNSVEGASQEDIRGLPTFKFRRLGDADKLDSEIAAPVGGVMTKVGSNPPVEHIILPENAECCICLVHYNDGVELRGLPCQHHFHCGCIDKWLLINATCPLCKISILSRHQRSREEV